MPGAQPLEEDPAGWIGDGGQDGIHAENMQPAGCAFQVRRATTGPERRPLGTMLPCA
jgi:hypothetical protein